MLLEEKARKNYEGLYLGGGMGHFSVKYLYMSSSALNTVVIKATNMCELIRIHVSLLVLPYQISA